MKVTMAELMKKSADMLVNAVLALLVLVAVAVMDAAFLIGLYGFRLITSCLKTFRTCRAVAKREVYSRNPY